MHRLLGEMRYLLLEVWTTILGADAPTVHIGPLPPTGEEWVSARVNIRGDANWGVVLSCPMSAAAKAAASMFQMPLEDLDEEMTLDAMGEISNIFGGNVKAMLSGSSRLSLPRVGKGPDHREVESDEEYAFTFHLDSFGAPFEIICLKGDPASTEDQRGEPEGTLRPFGPTFATPKDQG